MPNILVLFYLPTSHENMMNLVLYYLIMATFVPIAISQGLFDFIDDYYGNCAVSIEVVFI